ncbi:MAG: DUF4397 domain-containing protein [Salibacteraceae bacterium]
MQDAAYLHAMNLLARIVFILSCVFIFGSSASSQTAHLQFVHNSADTSLQTIDIWVGNTKLVDDLVFQTASAPIAITAGALTEIRVMQANSEDTITPILLWSDSLQDSSFHQLALSGLASATGYSHFEPLNFVDLGDIRQNSQAFDDTDIKFYNGITDFDLITVMETKLGLGNIITDLGYGQYSAYSSLSTFNYRFVLQDTSSEIQGEFDLNLVSQNLTDSALTLIMSGFANSEENNNGAPMALIGVLPGGATISFDKSMGEMQLIHNSADPTLDEMDIYVDDVLILNDLLFRQASGYLSFPSGKAMNLAFAPANSSSSAEAFFTQNIALEAETPYVAIAAGNQSGSPSPETSFSIFLKKSRKAAQLSNQCDVLFFHGASDAGPVRVNETKALSNELFSSTDFGAFHAYSSLPLTDYKLDLILENDNSVFETYDFTLSQLNFQGEAITLMTSGFVDTSSFIGSEEMSLWLARSSSGLMLEVDLTVGTQELKNPNWKVYPQPANNELNIISEQSLDKLRVYNLQGKLLLERTVNGTSYLLNTSFLSPGAYILVSENNNTVNKLLFQVTY